MEANIHALLTELEEWGRHNDASQSERSKKMLNLAPETAQLISILIRCSRCTRLLEIGTSNGYSTIWLAWAARAAEGRVLSIDQDADKHTLADANLRRAGLRASVDLLHGEASAIIATLPGPFDFLFFDADRVSAPTQLTLLLSKLTPGALVLADNALSHPDEIAGYLDALKAMHDFDHVVVPIGKGLSIAYKRPTLE
jgi:predicted O-methyltransferase YrrM